MTVQPVGTPTNYKFATCETRAPMFASLVKDTEASIRFLSRLPVRDPLDDALPEFRKTAHTFPLAGMIIALPTACVLWLGWLTGLPHLVTAILSTAAMVITTGALHEDGLADVCDGFWGGHSKKRKLEIMRDSAIGTYGTLGLILGLTLKIVLIAQLLPLFGGIVGAFIIVASAALSRLAILQQWSALPAARNEETDDGMVNGKPSAGLSVVYGSANLATFQRGVVLALPALVIILFAAGLWPFIAALILMQAVIVGFTALCKHHIGGHTGDTLGATQQVSELGLLLALIWTM